MRWGHVANIPEPVEVKAPKQPIEAWLVGGPAGDITVPAVPGFTTELNSHGGLYRRRPNGDVTVPRSNRDHATEASYVFAAYFDHVDENGCDK